MASERDCPPSGAHPHRRPLELDRFINQFLDAACDESRRAILELLVPPQDRNPQRAMNCVRGDCSVSSSSESSGATEG